MTQQNHQLLSSVRHLLHSHQNALQVEPYEFS